MPESVKDRVRRSHETWFHLVKSPRYFAAVDEIRTPAVRTDVRAPARRNLDGGAYGVAAQTGLTGRANHPLGSLPGSVWQIATQPLRVPPELAVDHFAAFPMEWPRRIISGWSPSGICTACGEGRRPVADVSRRVDRYHARQNLGETWAPGRSGPVGRDAEVAARNSTLHTETTRRITGYICACPDAIAPTRPAVVLDPFGGTGTTALVASVLGRRGISVDMSADYCRIAEWRVNDPKQRARALRGPASRPAKKAA